MNSVPWLRVICPGNGYLVKHIFLRMSLCYFGRAVLFSICCISKQPVAGWIMVRHHTFKSSLPLHWILYEPIRSTHSVPHGFSSACLAGSLPYFWFVTFAFWQNWHFLHVAITTVHRPFQSKCSCIVSPVLVLPGWHSISWYQSIVFCCSDGGRAIFSFLWHVNLCSLSPPR